MYDASPKLNWCPYGCHCTVRRGWMWLHGLRHGDWLDPVVTSAVIVTGAICAGWLVAR